MVDDATARGGEDLACAFLRERGWEILERNWTRKLGELDIVARRSLDPTAEGIDLIAFVEVKTREQTRGPVPELRVSAAKRRKLATLGRLWMSEARAQRCYARFDVIGVDLDTGAIRHYPSAFDASGALR